MTEFILYGGKGGVGKTTMAAATALRLANEGHDTLVVSTDPAHSISDSYGSDVGTEPDQIRDHLWAVEVEAQEAMEEYRGKVEEIPQQEGQGEGPLGLDLEGLGGIGEELGEDMGEIFSDALGAPGADEAAAIFKFIEYMESDEYDYVVFDTAPTGHTLKLLRLPEVLDSMLGKVIRIRSRIQGTIDSVKQLLGGEESQTTTPEQLEDFKARVERIRAKLQDPDQTDFRVVTIPEHMAITETQRLIEQLSRFQIPVRTVVINKVMEDVNEDCEFCQNRWEVQRGNLEEAEEMFRDLEMKTVPLMQEEVQGDAVLERVAERLED